MAHTITAWIFDAYPLGEGMALWFIDREGEKHRAWAPFAPSFFLHLSDADCARAEHLARRAPMPLSFARTERRDLYSNELWSVLKVNVHNAPQFRSAVSFFESFFPHFAFFTSDLLPAQLFFYETDLFPLAYGDYELDEAGRLTGWTLNDSRERTEYELPPLSMMLLRNANDFVHPKYHRALQLEVVYDGRTYALEQENPREVLESFNWHLHSHDPDLLLTEYGDGVLLPRLAALSKRCGVPLLLNRDDAADYRLTRESSFWQYGKVVHKDGAFELAGRWHVDVENSFTIVESDLEGLFELARITQMPPQRQARASIGTGLSSLQLSWAHRNGYLIPAKKREPEEFKPASTLMLADRGGLIFQPPVGYHDDVAELDFVSMYPSIMVNHNVSPETINCRCCSNAAVPELGYTICERREGLVPATLRMVVEKRAYYKKKKKEMKGKDEVLYRRYDRRQNSLKWMLVSCFGYLGYKNARFGRIEAHESVNAFSRNAILAAKEVAESHGYRLLHAIIDCVWLTKPGSTEEDYERLCREISARVGVDISLEGIYDWIVFPASKQDPNISTANRYAGRYRHGEVKIRGIESRRHDTPRLIKAMQAAMLEQMSSARSVDDVAALAPDLLETVHGYVSLVQSGRANPMDLVLRRRITKEADEYANNSISAVVSKMVEETGVHLAAGEAIEYIILDQSGKKKPDKAKPLALYAFEDGYDIDKYSELVLKAAETLLLPFGYSAEILAEQFGLGSNARRRSSSRASGSRFRRVPLMKELPLFQDVH
jgi:DNA polymerase elongation subunit (family B)